MRTRIVTILILLTCAFGAWGQAASMPRATNAIGSDLVTVTTNAAGNPGQIFTRAMTLDNFLRTLAGLDEWDDFAGGSGGVSNGDKGDITVSGGGGTWRVNTHVTNGMNTRITALEVAGPISSNALQTQVTTLTNGLNEGNTLYVRTNGNNSTALRGRKDLPFRDPKAAANAAQAGDLVWVTPGIYNTNNFLKKGVNYHFDEGAVVTNQARLNNAGWGLFDDRLTGATTNYISGSGTFWFNLVDPNIETATNALGMVVVTNNLSRIHFIAKDVRIWSPNSISPFPAFYLGDGTNFIDVDTVINPNYEDRWLQTEGPEGGAGVTWLKGEAFIRCRYMQVEQYGVWSDEPTAGATNNLFYEGDTMLTYGAACVYHDGVSPGYRTWVDVKDMIMAGQDRGAFAAITAYGGGKVYVNAMKISVPNDNRPVIQSDLGSDLELWVNSQKLSGKYGWLDLRAGKSHITVQQYEDTGGIDYGIRLGAGYHNIDGGFGQVLNGHGVEQRLGTNQIKGLVMDTRGTNATSGATNNRPVTVNGGRLSIIGGKFLAPATSYGLFSTNSQTAYLSGSIESSPLPNASLTLSGEGTNIYGGDIYAPNATAQTFAVWDGSKLLKGTIPTNSFATHAQTVTASNAVLAAARASDTTTSNGVLTAVGTSIAGPNNGSSIVDWTQLKNVPAGFADGTDDGGGGGGVSTVKTNAANVATSATSLILSNGYDTASPIVPRGGSNSATATVQFGIPDTSGAGHLVRSNNPAINNLAATGVLFVPSGSSIVNSNTSHRRRVVIFNDQQEMVPLLSPDISDAEVATLDGVTVNVQTQLDGKTSTNNQVFGSHFQSVSNAIIHYSKPLLNRGTNLWADGGTLGTGSAVWSNDVSIVGVTNVMLTNMVDGAVMNIWLTISPGVSVVFPQFTASQWTGGRVPGFSSNSVPINVTAWRQGVRTNLTVHQPDFVPIPGTNVVWVTNFATGEITMSATGSGGGSSTGIFPGLTNTARSVWSSAVTTTNVDWALRDRHVITNAIGVAATAIVFSNTIEGQIITLDFWNNTNATISFPASVFWHGNVAPTALTNGLTRFMFDVTQGRTNGQVVYVGGKVLDLFESVTINGATGNGTTDDTSAITNTVAIVSARGGGVVFFPEGTYLIRRPIYVPSNVEMRGVGAATKITKPASVRVAITNGASLSAGATSITLSDVSGFSVGSSIYLADTSSFEWASTKAVVTNISGNTLQFNVATLGSLQTNRGAFVTTDFPLIRNAVDGASNIVIRDLVLDQRRTAGVDATNEFTIGTIHYEGALNSLVHNVQILNASTDAYSDQATNGFGLTPSTNYIRVTRNIFQNSRIHSSGRHGVHLGTMMEGAVIANNEISNCGPNNNGYAMFYCAYVTYTTASGNIVDGCYSGFAGIDQRDYGNTIIGNTIRNCVNLSVDAATGSSDGTGGRLAIVGNTCFGRGIRIDQPNCTISGNTIDLAGVAASGIRLDGRADNCTVQGNTINSTAPGGSIGIEIIGSTDDVRLIGNVSTAQNAFSIQGATRLVGIGNRINAPTARSWHFTGAQSTNVFIRDEANNFSTPVLEDTAVLRLAYNGMGINTTNPAIGGSWNAASGRMFDGVVVGWTNSYGLQNFSIFRNGTGWTDMMARVGYLSHVPAITTSNLLIHPNTNRVTVVGCTNAVMTNIVEMVNGESCDVDVFFHNSTGVTMGLVWPSLGAQHGYYALTNLYGDAFSKTSLPSGARGEAQFRFYGTNVAISWRDL